MSRPAGRIELRGCCGLKGPCDGCSFFPWQGMRSHLQKSLERSWGEMIEIFLFSGLLFPKVTQQLLTVLLN